MEATYCTTIWSTSSGIVANISKPKRKRCSIPPVYPSIRPSICAAIHPFVVHSSIHRPFVVVASTHASTHLCMHPPTHASTIQRPVVQVYAHSRQEANTIDVHLTEISNSSTMEDYDVNLRCLRRVNKDIAEWVEKADPEFWVAAFFMHTQDAGMTTSNGISTPCSSPSIHPSVRSSIRLSVRSSVRLPSIRSSIRLSVRSSVRPSITIRVSVLCQGSSKRMHG